MALQLHPEHQLVQVELVRTDGSPALVGNYLVDMLPQTSSFLLKNTLFLINGRQRVPLAGVSFLQLGDVLGMASAPLLQIPLSAVTASIYLKILPLLPCLRFLETARPPLRFRRRLL